MNEKMTNSKASNYQTFDIVIAILGIALPVLAVFLPFCEYSILGKKKSYSLVQLFIENILFDNFIVIIGLLMVLAAGLLLLYSDGVDSNRTYTKEEYLKLLICPIMSIVAGLVGVIMLSAPITEKVGSSVFIYDTGFAVYLFYAEFVIICIENGMFFNEYIKKYIELFGEKGTDSSEIKDEPENSFNTIEKNLDTLRRLKDEGYITEEEYEKQREEVIKKL